MPSQLLLMLCAQVLIQQIPPNLAGRTEVAPVGGVMDDDVDPDFAALGVYRTSDGRIALPRAVIDRCRAGSADFRSNLNVDCTKLLALADGAEQQSAESALLPLFVENVAGVQARANGPLSSSNAAVVAREVGAGQISGDLAAVASRQRGQASSGN